MGLSFHFREKLLGPWETARGFLVAEMDYLFAGLVPIGPLIDSLQSQNPAQPGIYPASMVMTTDAKGVPAFSPILPMLLQFPAALIVTDTLVTGTVANYNPGGFDTAVQVRVAGGAATQLTGMHAPTAPGGVYKLLVNIGTTAITVLHRHASSTAINQFICPGGPTYTWPTTTAMWVWYDPIARGWQIIGK